MTTIATNLEGRQSRQQPIARKVVAITIPDGLTTGSTKTPINGELLGFVYDVPDLVGVATTVTFDLLDEDSFSWHQKASIAENAKTIEKLLPGATPYRFGFCGTAEFKATASTSQSPAQTINVTAYFR